MFKVFSIVMFFFLLGVSPSSLAGCSTSNNIRYKVAYKRHYLYMSDIARYYGMKLNIKGKQITLSSRYSTLTFTAQKRDTYINRTKVLLSFAPFILKGQAYISKVDFYKTLDAIMRPKTLARQAVKTIIIDPGHGGKDNGGKGVYVKEKQLALQIAAKLTTLLKQKGFRVILTRNKDHFLTLQQRTILAAKYKGDLFVSIHTNIASNKTVTGIETFCLAPTGTASTHGGIAVNKAEAGNKFDSKNFNLAYNIQQSLIKICNAKDRGVKRARFCVLRNAPCPAVLVECGFLSNRREESALRSVAYQRKLAQAMASGILKYCRNLLPTPKRK